MNPLFVVIGISLIVLIGVVMAKRWLAIQESLKSSIERETNSVFHDEPEAFLQRGYVFCTLFSIRDIEAVCVDMGIYLTRLEQIQVVAIIKQEFNPHKGINCSTIREAIVKLQTINANESAIESTED